MNRTISIAAALLLSGAGVAGLRLANPCGAASCRMPQQAASASTNSNRSKPMNTATTGTVLHAPQSDFDALLSDDKPVLVDFWAAWCPPCRAIAPTLDRLAVETAGQAAIAKIDIDQNQDLASRLGVRSIPTLVIFKNGKEVDRLVGVQSKEVLAERLARAGR